MALPTTQRPLDTRRPFTRADALAAGITPKMLRGSRFRRLFRGVYLSAKAPVNPLVRVQAALVLHPPTAFASHVSAARVYQLPVPDLPDEHVMVLNPADRRVRPGIRTHVAAADARVVRYRGVRVADLRQTFVQLASVLPLVDLVVVGDAMVKKFKLPPDDLIDACAHSSDRHAGTARRAASYVRDGVDSPMESRLRMLIVLSGLPEPDGRQHAEDPAQWNSDLDRREEFDIDGWRIVVVTAKGIYREPQRTLTRVQQALIARGHPSVPRRLSDEWRVHFAPGT